MRPASTVLLIPPLRRTQNTSDVIFAGRTHSRNRRNLNEQESSQESEMIFPKFTILAN